MALAPNLVLKSTETEGEPFSPKSGWISFLATIDTGTFPAGLEIRIQQRVHKGGGVHTLWSDTDAVLNATNGWAATIFTSQSFQYRLTATAVGAEVWTGNTYTEV